MSASYLGTQDTRDRLTLALDHLGAAESCLVYEATYRPHTLYSETRLEFVAKRARDIAERAEQAARNCATRRLNIEAADRSVAAMLNEERDDMDGDAQSALTSAGWGTDEDYGEAAQ